MHECVCMGERRRVLAPVYPYLSSMQRACVILSFAASSSPSYFFWHYLIKGTILEKNLLDIKCVSIFSTNFFKPFLILREIQRNIVINVKTSSCKVPVTHVRF